RTQPAQTRIEFRIGVNLGDIIIDGDDIFGDGVNIAARLEALAEPGGICISRTVLTQTRGKLDFRVADLGDQALKNIAQPVHVFRVLAEEKPVPEPAALALPEKPSIAVLPFQNMSGDPEQEYFADGIAEDVITLLSKSRGLFVIARNSTFTYKGRAIDVKMVGRDLGVRYVLEGSVRKAANRVRVTAQLIEAASGGHLWAERYDRDLTDIFAVQDEITASVSAAILPTMDRSERERAARKPPESLDAWESYHRGLWHYSKIEPEENTRAITFFERAIELDPDFAAAYAAMSAAWTARAILGRRPSGTPGIRAPPNSRGAPYPWTRRTRSGTPAYLGRSCTPATMKKQWRKPISRSASTPIRLRPFCLRFFTRVQRPTGRGDYAADDGDAPQPLRPVYAVFSPLPR
ncbi:MAG TPA: adenylate/guanylate cyclase domain-containing protein, partial [Stellaceae bacterium]